jgi:hypothetical protein
VNVTPGPASFKDALRLLYSRYIIAAGIALGVGAAALVLILWLGGWPAQYDGLIIQVFGKALLGAGIAQTLIIIFLGLGGPVRKLTATIWKASIETEGDSDCA